MKFFLSHSSKDKQFVARLANDLRLHQIEVWYDDWELSWGDSILEKIQKGITESEFIVVILSPDSVNSKWVKEELNAALIIELERQSVFILPILYKDCEIPAFLRDKKYIDFRGDYEVAFHQVLDFYRQVRAEPVYLNAELNNVLRLPIRNIQPDTLMQLVDKVSNIDLSKEQFEVLFRKILTTDLCTEPLMTKGLSFYTEEQLVELNISIRQLPFPQHRNISLNCALKKADFLKLAKYCGYDYFDERVHHEKLKMVLEVLHDLFSIGNTESIQIVGVFLERVGRYNKDLFILALRTRNRKILGAVLESACSGFVEDRIREEAFQAIAETLNFTYMREFIIDKFGTSDSYIQYSMLKHLTLFPPWMRILLARNGASSENWEVKKMAEEYRKLVSDNQGETK